MIGTLSEVRELARGADRTYDPLYNHCDAKAEARVQDTPEGLLLLGTHYFAPDGTEGTGEYADDLLVTPEEGGWWLRYRDPEGLPPGEGLWGREWLDGGHYTDWSDLVGFAYSL